MGWLGDVWAHLMRSLRLQTDVGSEWLGQQLRRLFPTNRSELAEERELLEIMVALDAWALELTPENYIGRLHKMVDTWMRRFATEAEVRAATRCIGDDFWLENAVQKVKGRDPDDDRLGFGLIALQGAFKKAGLITGPVLHDSVVFELRKM